VCRVFVTGALQGRTLDGRITISRVKKGIYNILFVRVYIVYDLILL